MAKTIVVTGGAGFIGSALVRHLIHRSDSRVVNLDSLTYAGNLESLASIEKDPRYECVIGDIANSKLVTELLTKLRPDAIVNLAAETHVDRSIDNPGNFIHTNINGTFALLQAARHYWNGLDRSAKEDFRFLHVSTDEVYGSLGKDGLLRESSPYNPSSPYSASKAASDHLVRAWHRTYGLPVLITNCCNNYGPYQFPEKLIPLMVLKALKGESLPVYGHGEQVRDWIYVEDSVKALLRVLEAGQPGQNYNIGSSNELGNREVIETLCGILADIDPSIGGKDHLSTLITPVADRPGHDQRYAIDNTKVIRELKWHPRETLESGLKKTVRWIFANQDYYNRIEGGNYAGERLGLRKAEL